MPAAVPGDTAVAGNVVVAPGGILNVRVRLAHLHEGNDGLDLLLGRRDVVIKIGQWTYKDAINIDQEQFVNLPDRDWRPMDSVLDEKRDKWVYFSAPDSLVLDASEPGYQYFRFPERKVRGGVKMRLRFRYQITPWSDGEFKVRVAQYVESPNRWRVLSESGFERELRKPPAKHTGKRGDVKAGEWLVFDEVFETHPEATTVSVDTRLSNAELGLAWLDDVEVSYVGVSDRTTNP